MNGPHVCTVCGASFVLVHPVSHRKTCERERCRKLHRARVACAGSKRRYEAAKAARA